MDWHIKEFAALTGVSVRTLHYYHQIGLLQPSRIDAGNGYRYYDESSLERMQQILFYRELDFSLKSIQAILSSPKYDKQKALARQKQLLLLKKARLERVIAALEQAEKGETDMTAFNTAEYDSARREYEAEARQRWGDTDAYRESRQKTADYSNEKWAAVTQGLEDIFAQFAVCKQSGSAPESQQAQSLVKKLQAYISENYYRCTDAILAGLGQMYVSDSRFQANIDAHGPGTAQFAADAIASYCRR